MFTTQNARIELREAIRRGFRSRFIKNDVLTAVVGVIFSRWRHTWFPVAGAIPTGAVLCDRNTLGALQLPSIPAGRSLFIAEMEINQGVLGCHILFDRLAHMGGLSGVIFTPTTQPVNLSIAAAAAQGRCMADGADVMWTLETYTDLGATAVTGTVTYTNQAGVPGRTTTVAIPATMRVGSNYPIFPNIDDTSIMSIQDITLSATTGTAGNFGVTAKRLLNEYNPDMIVKRYFADFGETGLIRLLGTECLELAIYCNSTAGGILKGYLLIITV